MPFDGTDFNTWPRPASNHGSNWLLNSILVVLWIILSLVLGLIAGIILGDLVGGLSKSPHSLASQIAGTSAFMLVSPAVLAWRIWG